MCQNSICELFEQGCVTPNPAASKVSIGTSSPFDLAIPLNIPEGWDETKCIVCTSVVGLIQLDKIRIKQFHIFSNEKCKWIKVRNLPNGVRKWHPASDLFGGTAVYGDPADDSAAWSIQFDNIPYNQIMFANEDFSNWVIAEKDVIVPEFTTYYNAKRMFLRSAENPLAPQLS